EHEPDSLGTTRPTRRCWITCGCGTRSIYRVRRSFGHIGGPAAPIIGRRDKDRNDLRASVRPIATVHHPIGPSDVGFAAIGLVKITHETFGHRPTTGRHHDGIR